MSAPQKIRVLAWREDRSVKPHFGQWGELAFTEVGATITSYVTEDGKVAFVQCGAPVPEFEIVSKPGVEVISGPNAGDFILRNVR